MRTTMDIEPDVLLAAKELARRQNLSVGKIMSNLLREAMVYAGSHRAGAPNAQSQNIFHAFPAQGVLVTDEHINHLRDVEGV